MNLPPLNESVSHLNSTTAGSEDMDKHTAYGEFSGPSMTTFHSWTLASLTRLTLMPAGGEPVTSAYSYVSESQ